MFDIGIIGAGPAGYSAAIRASQLGLKVVLFEKEFVGGTCLNKGCIPTKTILHSVNVYSQMKNANKLGILADNVSFDFAKIQERQKSVSEKIRKNLFNLIKSYGVEIVESIASIEDEHHIVANNNSYEVKNIIIATGSKPNNIKFNGNYESDFIKNSDDILNLTELPKSVLIVGSGAIGVEWTRIFSALGVKVIVVDMAEKLIPPADTDVSDRVARLFKRNRIEFYTSTTISSIENKTVKFVEQDHEKATVCRMFKSDFGLLDFNKNASDLVNLIRGLNPSPIAYFKLEENAYKVYKAKDFDKNYLDSFGVNFNNLKNGEIAVSKAKIGLLIKCADGYLSILEIQAPNSKRMDIKSFLNGKKLDTGKIVNE